MKTYIGMKVIKAEPMTREKAFHCGAVAHLTEENKSENGYLVEYSNPDGKTNYLSFSPKNVFERSYRELAQDEIEMISGK